jgi:hypothetical protein
MIHIGVGEINTTKNPTFAKWELVEEWRWGKLE